MTDVLAVANQKGGVAKTTTVHSLGVASAQAGRRTLVVDLDPQACLTYSLGFDPDALSRSLHDVFVRRSGMAEVILPVPGVGSLDVVPATIDLAGSEVHLLTRTGREHVLNVLSNRSSTGTSSCSSTALLRSASSPSTV